MSLPPEMSAVLALFQSLFTAPTWERVLILLVGTLLARGRRTVTAALRHMGLSERPTFSLYHHVLNRARWSALAASRQLLPVLVRTFVALGGAPTFVMTKLWSAVGAGGSRIGGITVIRWLRVNNVPSLPAGCAGLS
jgi:hypothetical protein